MKKLVLGLIAVALLTFALPQTGELSLPGGSDRVNSVEQAF
ncbi:hypothetical protein [Halalkalibacter alkalisediminis]|uniref:Uncharacterized protein n=1 Tax=Halalkalibacter alkalisediminis TaxID=935616 RepID=A0ABV6NIY6_9BACI|nr:hypothetical protein [Halalkalibacter alkalisediminis]